MIFKSEVASGLLRDAEAVFGTGKEALSGGDEPGAIGRFVQDCFGAPSAARPAEQISAGTIEDLTAFQNSITFQEDGRYVGSNSAAARNLSQPLKERLGYGVDEGPGYPTVKDFRFGTSLADKLKAVGVESAMRKGLGVHVEHQGDRL